MLAEKIKARRKSRNRPLPSLNRKKLLGIICVAIATGTLLYFWLRPPPPLVFIYVESTIYGDIQDLILQYQEDAIAQGYNASVVNWSGTSALELKTHIQGGWAQGLIGVVLVGQLPYARYTCDGEEFPCDWILADMDGTWEDNNSDGIFEK